MHILLTCILCITSFFFFCFIPWSNFLSTKLLIHKHKIKFEKKNATFEFERKLLKKKVAFFSLNRNHNKSQNFSRYFDETTTNKKNKCLYHFFFFNHQQKTTNYTPFQWSNLFLTLYSGLV
ncbi:predicted protein [Candida tropicalis MYA-3404]|uniref:Uncharacterized protein n=1 Tax=Candida tropicalis (strain ATCC MYA-3404 / T1) TaxID=294747 RepID=C5M1Y4_CANTT|nr:predicted protein [Candida tropicalis MYA-3404]EER35334.1 predicted protein [Candida tropicalis MYA-3404]KAG4409437.1 hypothetical protein JTP64_000075 [Candida tropicalis]